MFLHVSGRMPVPDALFGCQRLIAKVRGIVLGLGDEPGDESEGGILRTLCACFLRTGTDGRVPGLGGGVYLVGEWCSKDSLKLPVVGLSI